MALLRHHRARVRQLVLADTKAGSDDAAAVARRTDQQDQLRAGAEVGSLAKGMVEGLVSGASMTGPSSSITCWPSPMAPDPRAGSPLSRP
jgi:hypothetical protein